MTQDPNTTSFESLLAALAAAAEPTRLRLLALLAEAELTVTELVTILGQSQPRISRHLKLLGRSRPRRAPSRGRLGLFPDRAGQRQPAALVPRHPRAALPPTTRRAPPTASASPKCAAPAPNRRPAISPPMPPIGTSCARCIFPKSGSRRQLRDLVGSAPLNAVLDLGTGTGRMLELLAPLAVARGRHRSIAANARRRPRAARKGRPAQRAAAPGRHLCAAGRARLLRSRHHPSGAALSRRSGPRACARRRARCALPAACSSSISPRMRKRACASSMRIAASALPARRSQA